MKKIIVIISLILIAGISFGLMYYFNDKNNIKKDDLVKPPKEVIPEKKLQIINLDSNSRSVAVMINNHAQARPNHAGLQDAYIMYEAIVEGGITRMLAIFKDQTTAKIGSVRSARPYFLDYVLENDAIYVHFGFSEQARIDISKLGINNINGLYDSAFFRDSSLNVDYEHRAFTTMELVNKEIEKKKYRNRSSEILLKYSIDEIDLSARTDAVLANSVVVPYSYYMTSSYTYDSVNKYYNRFANSVPHTDAITKIQYHFKNIIVINVENYTTNEGGNRQALSNIGTGNGYFITNGYAVPITWTKASREAKTIYKYIDGSEVNVNDGNTFIQIQPINQMTTIG